MRFLGRHITQLAGAQTLPQSFVAQEKEGPVFLDRSAGGDSELVARERWFLLVEEVAGVQSVIAREVEDISMEMVCPAFGDIANLSKTAKKGASLDWFAESPILA